MSRKFYKLSEIEEQPIRRIQTGNENIDRLFGKSIIDGYDEYGLPSGKVILISGSRGSGKSRLCTAISGSISYSNKVLYFQQEVSKEEFKNWSKPFDINFSNFFISESNKIEEQEEIIYNLMPDVVIVDSLNMIENIKSINKCKEILKKYKDIANKYDITFILIGFLNKAGETKGNNDIEHLVDVICHVRIPDLKKIPKDEQINYKGVFIFEIGGKNRYGQVGGKIYLQHDDEFGIIYPTVTIKT